MSVTTPRPDNPPDTALPSVTARVVAFAAILAGGAAGGLIGYSFLELQCDGDCTVAAGLALVGGALVTSVGVAVVAVLSLRALVEWDRKNQQ